MSVTWDDTVSTGDKGLHTWANDIIKAIKRRGPKYVVTTDAYGDYQCDGTADDVQIQEALDALTAGRSYEEKVLVKGSFTVADTIKIPSYTILEIQGKIALANAVDKDLIENSDQVGGNTKISVLGGILDGNRANQTSDCSPISFLKLTDSYVVGTHVKEGYYHGIEFRDGCENVWAINMLGEACTNDAFEAYAADLDYCGFIRCHARDNTTATGGGFHAYGDGVMLNSCIAENNAAYGFELYMLKHSSIVNCVALGNDNGFGILNCVESTFTGNTADANANNAFRLSTADDNVFVGNIANGSTGAAPGGNGFVIIDSDRNFFGGNFCKDNNVYGIRIHDATSNGNVFADTNIFSGNGTAPLLDGGVNTKYPSLNVPFVDGTQAGADGWLIDADTEYARAYFNLPLKVQQVIAMKIYARSNVTEADAMRLQWQIYAGADNESYTAHGAAEVDKASESSNFAANDVIYWKATSPVTAFQGGDSGYVVILHEGAGGADVATDGRFRAVSIEYV